MKSLCRRHWFELVLGVAWAVVFSLGISAWSLEAPRPQPPGAAANQPAPPRPPATANQPTPPRPPAPGAAPVPPAAPPKPPASSPAPPSPRERLPLPEEVSGTELLTKDGIQLRATYYPSNRGKDAAVVILLHGWKGSRKDFARIGPFLQQQGYAVFIPDLRGHGESTQRLFPSPGTVTVDKMPPAEIARMVDMDLETCKRFLLQKNNAGELNIEKLCVLGIDATATVALDWARHDWSWPIYPGLKQGQDVKALILVSPKWSVPGLNAQAALSHPAVSGKLAIYIMVGKDSQKDLADAQRMYNIFARFHPKQDEQSPELQDLFFVKFPTSAQGVELLTRFEQAILQSIAFFIEQRVAKQPWPWQDRSRKKEG
ncbi:MAG TPA: alpha/beta fold hydrolase [Thermogutta sp.]|nr:alpha/beta fold hydrolase [Thermogutta sp.]